MMQRVRFGYGFTIVAKVKEGAAETIRSRGLELASALESDPLLLAPLELHYLRWVLFDDDTRFMFHGIFDVELDKRPEEAVALLGTSRVAAVFETLERFPADWQTNTAAFVQFVRAHQCAGVLEYGEFPYSADEIKKALRIKAAVREIIDQMG